LIYNFSHLKKHGFILNRLVYIQFPEADYLIDVEFTKKVANKLTEKKLTIAVAESCTGGMIANTLTNISGSSQYFERGIVSYSNKAKKELLDVTDELLEKYGAVSDQVAVAMAENIRKKSNVDIGIATTGVAGPTGGTKDKPVGVVFIAISTKDVTNAIKYNFKGTRLENKENTVLAVFDMILKVLRD